MPTQLNSLLREGAIDICPSSSIEYIVNYGSYLIVDTLSISSLKKVQSVLLFSRLPIKNLNGKKIALTKTSATSVILLEIILKAFLGFQNKFFWMMENIPDPPEDADAFLVIGDEALEWSEKYKDKFFIYDLGELWYKNTKTPFVFALWLINKNSFEAKKKVLKSFITDVVEAKKIAVSKLNELAKLGDENRWIKKGELVTYWKTISYDLTEEHLKGLNLFFELSSKIKNFNKPKKLDFVKF